MRKFCALLPGLLLAALSASAGGPTVTLPVFLHNYTVRLTLNSLRVAPAYGVESAAAGTQFFVFAATFEDVVDPTLAKARELPLGVKDDNLSDGLSLVIDDSVVVPVLSRATNTAGMDANDSDIVGRAGGSTDAAYIRPVVGLKNPAGKRSLVYYALDQPGSKASGDLLFAVPVTPWHKLELRYHDPTGGDCAVLLAGPAPAAGSVGMVTDPTGAVTNDVFVLAARISEDPAGGMPEPPPGRRYVAIDFQGRSVLKVQDHFPPYDPTHPADTEFWRADPAGWGDVSDSLQLVADGRYPGVTDKIGDADGINFVPGVWTHQRLVYLVPASARSLDLICFFNDYAIPGHDATVTPTPVHFHLAGPIVPPPAASDGEKHFTDGPMADDVLKHATSAHFAGVAANPEEKFLVVDFAVRNTGTEVAEFHAVEQLVWFNDDGEVPPDDLTARGPLAPPDYVKLAAGEMRTFQVVWRVPANLAKANLGLKGNVVAEKFTLAVGNL